MEAAFEIGLIETGEGHVRVHRDEERIEILGVVVFVFEARDGFTGRGDRSSEIHADSVFAYVHGTWGELDVAIFDFRRDRDAVDDEICQGTLAKINKNRSGRAGTKLKVFVAGCGRRAGSEREAKMIANIGKLRGALAREFARDAVGRRRSQQIIGSQQCE